MAFLKTRGWIKSVFVLSPTLFLKVEMLDMTLAAYFPYVMSSTIKKKQYVHVNKLKNIVWIRASLYLKHARVQSRVSATRDI